MLINTVVLLLRDLLPIVILLCFLRSFVASSAFSFTHIRNIAISSSLFVLLFIQIVEPISEWFMGAGLELIQVGFISVSFVLLVLITLLNIVGRKPILSKALTHLAIEMFIVIKASNFVVFLHVYLQDKTEVLNVLIGIILGAGICLSFGAIFYYLLKEWQETSFNYLLYGLWFLFLTGIICQILPLLAQINMLTLSAPVWQSGDFIENSSEYGQLLSALIGYQSSPSKEFLWVYSSVFLVLLLLAFSVHFTLDKHQGNRHE